MTIRTLATPLLISLIAPAVGEESQCSRHAACDDAVVVTGSRLPQVSRAAGIDVIDANEIAERGAGSLIDLLRQTPGLSVSQPGGSGGFAEVFMNGAESNFTLVMVDGVKMNDPTNTRGGAFDFSSLGLDEIERIEIIRGPVSAVYGSEALAGVINVITHARSRDTLHARAGMGSSGYSNLSAQLAAPLGERGHASLRMLYHDAGEPVAGSTLQRKSAQASATYDISRSMTAEMAVRYTTRSRSTFPDASGGPRFAVLRDLEKSEADESALSVRARYDVTARWSIDLTGSLLQRDDKVFTPAIAPGVIDGQPMQLADTRFEQSQLVLAARFAPSSSFSLGFGVDGNHSRGRRDSVIDFGGFHLPSNFSLRRETTAAFFESWWQANDVIEVFGGIRRDHTGGADDRYSTRLGATYRGASDLWQLRASWGDGFKLPSFYALGDNLIGNPALARERGTSFELDTRLRLLGGRLTFGANGFSSVYRDLIDFDFATFTLVNRSRADIDGIGVSLAADTGESWHFVLNAMRTHTELASGGMLLNRPDDMAGAITTWRPRARWTLTSALQYVGDRAASSVATGDVILDHYVRLDMAATYALNAMIDLQGAIDNVFAAGYEDSPGFPSAGRIFRIGIRTRL
jgi:vitamin B12 transporter